MKFVLFALASLSRINIPRSCVMYLVFPALFGKAASLRQKACSETAGSRSAYQGANWQVKLRFLIWKLRRNWEYPNKKSPCSLSADRNLWEQKGLQAAQWEVKVADSAFSSPCCQKSEPSYLFLVNWQRTFPYVYQKNSYTSFKTQSKHYFFWEAFSGFSTWDGSSPMP